MSVLFPVKTTWRDTHAAVQPFLAESRMSDDAVEATLNTLRELFFRSRAAVFVAVKDGTLAAFVPFANTQYTNPWGARAVLQGPRGPVPFADVAVYAAEKAAATRRPLESMLPLDKWWTNGSVVCNVMPPDGWGQGFLAELHDMLTAALEDDSTAKSTACFFLNKRDYPLLRRDGADAAADFVGRDAGDARRGAGCHHAPVFSWYVGSRFRDVAMPVVDDWTCDAVAWAALRERCPLACRPAVAVFRGAATGPLEVARNPRARAVATAAEVTPTAADLDIRLTGWNLGRDRVALNAAGCPEVRFGTTVRTIRGRPLPALAPFEPLMAQASRARFLVYIDGHCAASRFGTLMHSGAVILRVLSEQADTCGDTWIFQQPDVCGVPAGGVADPALLARADHITVASAEDLPAAVAWAAALPITILEGISTNAAARAPTRSSIARWWGATICGLGRQQQRQTDTADGTAVPWFTPRDPRYAALDVARDAARDAARCALGGSTNL